MNLASSCLSVGVALLPSMAAVVAAAETAIVVAVVVVVVSVVVGVVVPRATVHVAHRSG